MDDLLNVVPGGVLVFDDGGTILSANRTLKTWLGYSDQEIEGRNIETILTVASRIFYQTHFFPLIKLHGKADEIFLTLLGKDKNDIPVLTNTLRHSQNGTDLNVSVFMPVFQRRKYEDEILAARRLAENALRENKDLEALTRDLESRTQELDKQYQKILAVNQDILQFSKIVSHDLQEPIRKIRLFSSILSSTDIHLSPKSHSAIKRIDASAERLTQLTLGLRQYVSVDAENVQGKVDLNEVIGAARAKVTVARDFHDFVFECERLPVMEGYGTQLELLFFHLFDNAIQYRKPDERLVIKVHHTLLDENIYRSIQEKYKFVEHVRILFSDNGIGFDDQYKEYVFDLVKKIDAKSKGLGIGLALIKKVVDNHSGSVRIESEAGKGTEAILVLPLKM